MSRKTINFNDKKYFIGCNDNDIIGPLCMTPAND